MKKSDQDAGTIAALMLRFKDYRLPRAQRMLKRVDQGEILSSEDIRFLNRVYDDSKQTQALRSRNPEYKELISKAIDLYSEIIEKGIRNEKNQGSL